MLVLAQLDCFGPLGPFSEPRLRLLVCFSDNEQRKCDAVGYSRVVVRVSAAVYRLSNVLLRGRKSSVRLIVPVFVCIPPQL